MSGTLGEADVCGNLIGSDVTEPQALWFALCMGGVPDKLCIFPADQLSRKQPLFGDHWLVWPPP